MANTSTHPPTDLSRGAYRLEITCAINFLGPLHTGTGERMSAATDAPVLRLPGGTPLLTGASIRGVLRDWCEREAPLMDIGQAVDRLFGATPKHQGNNRDHDRQGRLTVYDAKLNSVWQTTEATKADRYPAEIRDHVKIDRKHGAAAPGAKFDQEVALCNEAELTLVYEGDSKEDDEIQLLVVAINALREGLLSFGGKTGWGYGWAKLLDRSDNPKVRVHQRNEERGFAAYLTDRLNPNGASLRSSDMLPQRTNRTAQARAKNDAGGGPDRLYPQPWSWLWLDLALQFDGPMLIAGPARRDLGDDDVRGGYPKGHLKVPDDMYFTAVTDPKAPVLPASSLRGALRSHVEQIACTLDGKDSDARDPAPVQQIARRLFGFADDRTNDGQQGLVRIGDGTLDGPRHTVWMDHVAIDRITGFAAGRKLFNTLALASPRFKVPLLVRWHERVTDGSAGADVDRCGVALLLFALRDASERLLWVGSRSTRGYGHLKAVTIDGARFSLVGPNGRQEQPVPIEKSTMTQLAAVEPAKTILDCWSRWVAHCRQEV